MPEAGLVAREQRSPDLGLRTRVGRLLCKAEYSQPWCKFCASNWL